MLQPYLVLGLDPDSPTLDDAGVRSAYLTLTRRYPPATNGKRFAMIAAAYEKLKTARLRLQNSHCRTPTDTDLCLEALVEAASFKQSRLRLVDLLDAMGRDDV